MRSSSSQKNSVDVGGVAALADVLEAEAERRGEAQQPLEVGGAEAEAPPSTVPSVAMPSTSRPAVEGHAELVEEDLLAGAVGLERGGVDDLAQLRLDEEVAEHRELHGEVPHLVEGRVAGRRTSAV